MKYFAALNWLVFVALETFAQVALKLAAVDSDAASSLSGWIAALASNGWFQASLTADVLNFFAWMTILRRLDLSLAVPLSSLCYFAIVIVSTLLLRETVSVPQVVGLGLIGVGIILVAGLEGAETDTADPDNGGRS